MSRAGNLIQLCEGKQVGKIYHITSVEATWHILDEDQLKTFGGSISFTRNKDYKNVTGKWEGTGVIFTLDGDKLSNKYKITPFRDTKSGYGSDWEAEERIQGIVKPLSAYLLNIEIHKAVSPELQGALRRYLADHPKVTVTSGGTKPIPASISMASSLKTIEGYWWKGKVYSIPEFQKAHPKFADWEGEDLAAMKCWAIDPCEALPDDAVWVWPANREYRDDDAWPQGNPLDKLEIYVHCTEEGRALAAQVAKKIQQRFPDFKVDASVYKSPYADMGYDDEDEWDGRHTF